MPPGKAPSASGPGTPPPPRTPPPPPRTPLTRPALTRPPAPPSRRRPAPPSPPPPPSKGGPAASRCWPSRWRQRRRRPSARLGLAIDWTASASAKGSPPAGSRGLCAWISSFRPWDASQAPRPPPGGAHG
eukprot:876334-Prorocentrum_minimum.AAC.3